MRRKRRERVYMYIHKTGRISNPLYMATIMTRGGTGGHGVYASYDMTDVLRFVKMWREMQKIAASKKVL